MQAAVPAQILLATGLDQYRKPEKGMWDYFVTHGNDGKAPGSSANGLLACHELSTAGPAFCFKHGNPSQSACETAKCRPCNALPALSWPF